jgi:RNA polymerase sigma-70 factor (ECF subfamily)
MYKEKTDEKLLEYIVKRDEPAFKELVNRYAEKLYFLAYKFLYSKELSEDIVQECFIKLWTKSDTFDKSKASAKTYIYRIMINLCIDHNRKSNNKRTIFLGDKTETVIKIKSIKIEERLFNKEIKKFLMCAIKKLPKNQEIALNLYYLKELKQKEIAEIMNVSVKNVEILLFRAKKNLQKEFEKYAE